MSSERTKKDANGAGSDPAARSPSALAVLLMRRPYLSARVVEDDRSPATDRFAPASRVRPEVGETKEEEADGGG